jgi:hypothetical protein
MTEECLAGRQHVFINFRCVRCEQKEETEQVSEIHDQYKSSSKKINRILAYLKKRGPEGESWFFTEYDKEDVYGTYERTSNGELVSKFDQYSYFLDKKKKRRESKQLRVHACFRDMWPLYQKKLTDNFDKRYDELRQLFTPREITEEDVNLSEEEGIYTPLGLWTTELASIERYIEDVLFCSLRCLDPFTLNQVDYLIASYLYYFSDATQQQIAELPNSLYPNMSRTTLRKWVKDVKLIENTIESL